MKALTYVEVDIDYCSHTYGVAPCTASIPTTGDIKCFNCRKTCQDLANFDDAGATLRFAVDAAYLPREIEAIPSIEGVSFSPAIISLGENLGQRATLSVSFKDHPHSDTGTGFDKYLADRDYDPFAQGTFFGKFRARHPFLRNRALRLITGRLGDAFAGMETRHYVIDAFDGPGVDGKYTLTAKDVLKLADGDRAQAPALSNGFLVAAINTTDTAATLSPAGIGNAEYPASGHVAIGGKEICAFTRAGDVLTLTRAQLNTVAATHSDQDRVQLCLRYVAQDAADIIADLLQTYAAIDASFIPLADWQAETAAFLGTVYTATIAEPVAVNALVSELVEQAALALWWDDVQQTIRLQVLRGVVTEGDVFDEDTIWQNSFACQEQPDRRLSQVWTYFGQINPLLRLDQIDNFRSTAATISAQAEADYGSPVIKKIYSRWIAAFGRSVAQRLNDIQIGRFRDPPRRFTFDLMRYAGTAPLLGGGYQLGWWTLQDGTGARAAAPIQITRLNPQPDRFKLEAEEVLFDAPAADLTNRLVVIDSNVNDFNLRAAHDQIYPAAESGDAVTCTVNTGIIVGSSATATPAFDVGDWPAGVDVTLVVNGRIEGAGGNGGFGSSANFLGGGSPGDPGGPALYTRYAIDLDLSGAGEIWSGGGGGGGGGSNTGVTFAGGGGGGGGGSGTIGGGGGGGGGGLASNPGGSGLSGTDALGGGGGPGGFYPGISGGGGGKGGDPGLPGGHGIATLFDPAHLGGNAGAAIDGFSFVTVTAGPGDVRGAEIN